MEKSSMQNNHLLKRNILFYITVFGFWRKLWLLWNE